VNDRAVAASEQRVLLLTRNGRDGALAEGILRRAGIDCVARADVDEVCTDVEAGVGALVLSEEALPAGRYPDLMRCLAHQAPWSDLPILVLARPGAGSDRVARAVELFGNVTVL
jgi:hypothetical protein